jgi:hypothetical protein
LHLPFLQSEISNLKFAISAAVVSAAPPLAAPVRVNSRANETHILRARPPVFRIPLAATLH